MDYDDWSPLCRYVLSFTNADSYNSVKTHPIKKIFRTRESAETFAKTQPGYGLGIDWNVEVWQMEEI